MYIIGVNKMKENICKRCGKTWYQRKPEKSRVCPKCRSPYWDKERVMKWAIQRVEKKAIQNAI
jgi:ribosomal protein L37E